VTPLETIFVRAGLSVERGLSANVLEKGMAVLTVDAVCQKRLSLQHSERGEHFHTNPLDRVEDLIFNTNPQ